MNYLNIDQDKTEKTAKELNLLLADYSMYYQKIRNFHWNITGENFFDLHIKFENMYGDAQEKVDEIAERMVTLGYKPASNYSDYIEMSQLEESESEIEDKEMVKRLLEDHKTILTQMSKVAEAAEAANDSGTEDLMDGYTADLEETVWMLTAWSKKTGEGFKSL